MREVLLGWIQDLSQVAKPILPSILSVQNLVGLSELLSVISIIFLKLVSLEYLLNSFEDGPANLLPLLRVKIKFCSLVFISLLRFFDVQVIEVLFELDNFLKLLRALEIFGGLDSLGFEQERIAEQGLERLDLIIILLVIEWVHVWLLLSCFWDLLFSNFNFVD